MLSISSTLDTAIRLVLYRQRATCKKIELLQICALLEIRRRDWEWLYQFRQSDVSRKYIAPFPSASQEPQEEAFTYLKLYWYRIQKTVVCSKTPQKKVKRPLPYLLGSFCSRRIIYKSHWKHIQQATTFEASTSTSLPSNCLSKRRSGVK